LQTGVWRDVLLLGLHEARRNHNTASLVQEGRTKGRMMSPGAIHRFRGLVFQMLRDLELAIAAQRQSLADSKRRSHAANLKFDGNALRTVLDNCALPGQQADFVVETELRILVFTGVSKVRENLLPAARIKVEESGRRSCF